MRRRQDTRRGAEQTHEDREWLDQKDGEEQMLTNLTAREGDEGAPGIEGRDGGWDGDCDCGRIDNRAERDKRNERGR